MTYITSIGLDVHARSVSAWRLRPVHRRGGPEEVRHRRRRDRGVTGLREPQGGLRERPDGLRPVPRAARAGRRLRRGRRLEDAEAVGREEAQERQARRRLPGAPARHAEHHRGVGAARRGGGRPRPVARARRRPRGPAARPPAALQVPAGARARVRRDRRARAQARRLDEGVLEVGGVLQAVRPGRGGRLRPLRRLRALRRVRQARPGEEGARRGPRRPVEGRGRGALVHQGHRRVTAFCLSTEAGCFSRFPTAGAYASWLGLAPSEHSSGEKEAKGGIAKTGNSASRRALVEAAWHFKSCSPKPKAPPAGSAVPAAVKRRCDDATARLRRRHESLGAAASGPASPTSRSPASSPAGSGRSAGAPRGRSRSSPGPT